MRVITGSARGCRLRSVDGELTRPTSAFVKESVFNILQFDIEGRDFLDLFAGTGQMGIEALSRGALKAVFVDNAQAALAVIRDNLRHTKFTDKALVVERDALSYLASKPGPFDIVYVDPPYHMGYAKILDAITSFDILREGGIIVCESAEGTFAPAVEPPYRRGKTYRYGKKAVTLYYRQEEPV